MRFAALSPASCLLLPWLALAGCTDTDPPEAALTDATPAAPDPIIAGRSARGRDRAVVALSIDDQALCTGALVAPDVVLTARHCVSLTVEAIDCDSKAPQIVGDRPAESILVLVGDDLATARPVALGAELFVPPGASLCAHDLALVRLDRAVTGVTPLAVATTKEDLTDHLIRAVGFGQRHDEGPAGRKFVRTHVPVLASGASELRVGEVGCHGDSGGPAIDEATGRLVGVLSRGGPSCEGPDVRNIYTRTAAFTKLLKQAGVPR